MLKPGLHIGVAKFLLIILVLLSFAATSILTAQGGRPTTVPSNGAVGVSIDTKVTIRYRKPIDPASLHNTHLQKRTENESDDDPNPTVILIPEPLRKRLAARHASPLVLAKAGLDGHLTLSSDRHELTFDPVGTLQPRTTYALLVRNLKSGDGQRLPDLVATWQTVSMSPRNPVLPAVVRRSIPFGAFNVDPNAVIAFRFEAPLDLQSVNSHTVQFVTFSLNEAHEISEKIIPATPSLSADRLQLQLRPAGKMANNKFYAVRISSRVSCGSCEEYFVNIGQWVTSKMIAPPPPPNTFRVKSVSPQWAELNVSRTTFVDVTFEGGTVDCTFIKSALQFSTYAPTFPNSLVADGWNGGVAHCNAQLNRATLEIPTSPLLYGAATYNVQVFAGSTDGRLMTEPYTSFFRTKNPGLVVELRRIGIEDNENDDGTDPDVDFYLMCTTADGKVKSDYRWPTAGEWDANNWDVLPDGYVMPPEIFRTGEIGEYLALYALGMDEDPDGSQAAIFDSVKKVGEGLLKLVPVFGEGAAAIWGGLVDFVKSVVGENEDDIVGEYYATWDVSTRWGGVYKLDDVKGNGGLRLWLRVREFPPGP